MALLLLGKKVQLYTFFRYKNARWMKQELDYSGFCVHHLSATIFICTNAFNYFENKRTVRLTTL